MKKTFKINDSINNRHHETLETSSWCRSGETMEVKQNAEIKIENLHSTELWVINADWNLNLNKSDKIIQL